MKKKLFTLALLVSLAAPAVAAPIVTLGPPVADGFTTVDPGSIRVEKLEAGETVDLLLHLTIHPFCIRPIDIGLSTTGDGGTFTDGTGVVTNVCGDDTSRFAIRLTGDGLTHAFDIQFLDVDAGVPLVSISVQIFPGTAPVVTLGPPVTDSFTTIDPGSITVEMLGAGNFIDLQLSLTVHPFCIIPIDVGLAAVGDGGTLTDLTGALVNVCGGDISEFNIRLTGDGLAHAFEIELLDLNAGVPIGSISVQIFPGTGPVVTLGPPVNGPFTTVDPGSISVEMLGAGHFIDLQVSLTVHPFCVIPIDVGLAAAGDGGTFTDLTGALVNGCGGDVSEFNIRLTGDGLVHAFDIEVLDLNGGVPIGSIPVELFPGADDTDSDGISDLSDNCVQAANADQRDTDADSIGNACDPDIASPNNCIVNFADLDTLKNAFFSTPAAPQWNADADFNGDNSVNFADLETMKSKFFGAPGPSANGCN